MTMLFPSEMCTVSSVFRLPMNFFSGAAIFAEESQEPKSKHIKRRKKSSEQTNRPIHPASIDAGVGPPKNCIFAEEAGERWKSADGEGGHGHGPESPRDFGSQ